MPNFKPKAKKKLKVSDKASVTLDSKHSEKMFKSENLYFVKKKKSFCRPPRPVSQRSWSWSLF